MRLKRAVLSAAFLLFLFSFICLATGAEGKARVADEYRDILPYSAVPTSFSSAEVTNEDGTITAFIFDEPLWYADLASGKFKEISLVFADNAEDGKCSEGIARTCFDAGRVTVSTDAWSLAFDHAKASIVPLGKSGSAPLTLDAKSLSASFDGDKAEVVSLFEGVSFNYFAMADGVKEEILVDRSLGGFVYSVPFSASGFSAQGVSRTGDGFVFGGFYFKAPFVVDAVGETVFLEHAVEWVDWGQYVYYLWLPEDVEEGLVFPIVVDPTVVIHDNWWINLVEDSMISNLNPLTNYGNNPVVELRKYSTHRFRGVFGFTLSPFVPSGAVITSLSFGVYGVSNFRDGPYQCAHGNYLNWALLTGGYDWVESEVSWNNYKTGSAWGTAGGDYGSIRCNPHYSAAESKWTSCTLASHGLTAARNMFTAYGRVSFVLLLSEHLSDCTDYPLYLSSSESSLKPYVIVTYSAVPFNDNVLFCEAESDTLDLFPYGSSIELVNLTAWTYGGINLVKNPGFELATTTTPATDWTRSGTSVTRQVTAPIRSGAARLRINSVNQYARQAITTSILPYTSYRVSGWVHSTNVAGTCSINATHAAGGCAVEATILNEWQYLECYLTTGNSPGTSYVYATGTTGSVCSFDDMRFEEIPIVPLEVNLTSATVNYTFCTGGLNASYVFEEEGIWHVVRDKYFTNETYDYHTRMLDGGYATFDGSGANYGVYSDLAEGLPEITVAAWITARPTSETGGYMEVVHQQASGDNNILLRVSNDTRFHSYIYNSTSSWRSQHMDAQVRDGSPHFIAFSANLTNKTRWMYADGVMSAKVVDDNLPALTQSSAGRLEIGHTTPSAAWHGNIYDVKIWNRSLSESELAEAMAYGIPHPGNLVGWWPLDEAFGSVAYDHSPSSANMTASGNPVFHSFAALTGVLSDDFTGSALDTSKWTSSGSGSIAFNKGLVELTSTNGNNSTITSDVSVLRGDFNARVGALTGAHNDLEFGFGDGSRFIGFRLASDGSLVVVTNNGVSSVSTTIPTAYTTTRSNEAVLDQYKIEWRSNLTYFYVNNILIAGHNSSIPTVALPMRFTTVNSGAGTLLVDYAQLSQEGTTLFNETLVILYIPPLSWSNGTASYVTGVQTSGGVARQRTGITVIGAGNCTVPIDWSYSAFGNVTNSTGGVVAGATPGATNVTFACTYAESPYAMAWTNHQEFIIANNTCPGNYTALVNYTFRDESTGDGVLGDVTNFIFTTSFLNATGLTLDDSARFEACYHNRLAGDPDFEVTLRAEYTNATSSARSHVLTKNRSDPKDEVILWLLNLGVGTYYTFTVQNQFGVPIQGVTVRFSRYSVLLGEWIQTEMFVTDSNGRGVGLLEPVVEYRLNATAHAHQPLNQIYTPTLITVDTITMYLVGMVDISLPETEAVWRDTTLTMAPRGGFYTDPVTVTMTVANEDTGANNIDYYGLVVTRFYRGEYSIEYFTNFTADSDGGTLSTVVDLPGRYSYQVWFKHKNFTLYSNYPVTFYLGENTGLAEARTLFYTGDIIGPWAFYLLAVLFAAVASGFVARYTFSGAGVAGLLVLWGFTALWWDAEILALVPGVTLTAFGATVLTTIGVLGGFFILNQL